MRLDLSIKIVLARCGTWDDERVEQTMNETKMPNENMAEITKYIEQMTIKRAFLGFKRKDVYHKIMELQNMFTEREGELSLQLESLQQRLSQAEAEVVDLKCKLDEDESIQKANTNARLIIERAKIDAELEALKLRKKQRAEKEKYEVWRQHTEVAGQEVLDDLKQVAEWIVSLDVGV